jgi:hypothetical protein
MNNPINSDTWLIWLAWFAVSATIFLLGVFVGRNDNGRVETVTDTKVIYSGEFKDVPMFMESSSGNTFEYLCDFHFTPDKPEHSAECEYQP